MTAPLMDKSKLRELLANTKTFNYNVYGGVDAFDNSISFEEALDEIIALTDSYYLGLIGEDEDIDPMNNGVMVDLEAYSRNQLRSELRNRIGGSDE